MHYLEREFAKVESVTTAMAFKAPNDKSPQMCNKATETIDEEAS